MDCRAWPGRRTRRRRERRRPFARAAQGGFGLRRAGRSRLSVRAGGKKTPHGWTASSKRPPTGARRRWSARSPNARPGDPRRGALWTTRPRRRRWRGPDSVGLLELSRGQPPKTACAATAREREHLYLRYPSVQERWAGAVHAAGEERPGLLGDGLDGRGEKGRVRRFHHGPAQRHGTSLSMAGPVAPARAAWLLGCVRAATSGEILF